MKISKKVLVGLASTGMVLSIATVVVPPTTVNATDNVAVSSVKDAINKLINSKNYTIEVATKTGPIDINYNIYYTENGFYDDYLGDEYGYVAVDEGVFSFDLYNREMTASNLLKNGKGELLTSVWDGDLFYSFSDLKADEFNNATSKEFTSVSKRVKTAFLNMFHVNFGYYQYVEPVEFKVGNDINSFEFRFSLSTGTFYEAKIKNFGTTKIDVVDDYLNSGNSYHQNDATIEKILELFSNYNYTRIIYDDSYQNDNNLDNDYSVIAGKEIYAENYFYTFLEDKYIMEGLGYEIGMVGINKTYGPIEANGTIYGPYPFKGSYYCFVEEDENGEYVLSSLMTSMPINTDPFVPNVYNYPTFLKMFKDTQYLIGTGGSATQYYTGKLACVDDFVSNFQIGSTLQEVGAFATGVYVEYLEKGSDKYAGTSGKETVVFSLEINYYGALTTLEYIYTDFNTTEISCLSSENIDAYIQNIIDNAIQKDAESEGA